MMQLTKTQAQQNLSVLLDKFQREWDSGQVKDYNEEATKTAFIQPLLKDVLGWDVTNRDEVSPEERTSRGRVDYGLKVAGKIKVFVEAKPLKADLEKHIEQAVGYGYNYKGVPFVLLTDFEGLKLFDVTIKPDVRNPKKGLKLELTWVQYRSQFDKLWQLSRESVISGELDKLLLVKPKDRVPVDKAILDDLKEWREDLAKNVFKHNRALYNSGNRENDAQFLKEITQRLLDRLIFMRFCEGRKLIHRQTLKEIFESRTDTVGLNTMVFLKEEFKHYNLIFDSDLFRPQEWEDNLQLEFKVLKSIILGTYNPYQFDVIPIEVLGNIYEQYLGYTIRLTDQQVKYELKPDVRKAGGVYYTPEYIVDYIVQNTVGKLLQELPAKRIGKLRILDPACGSGSFLIRAYSEMLKYYLDQKKAERSAVITKRADSSVVIASAAKQSHQSQLELDHQETEVTLSIEEKSRILREHIFGVDIDEQAVEVTKLSLMLKMLEGEYGIIPGRGILPMLDKNIKCGNSLISGSALELKQYFGEDWHKVKPFNWNEQFKPIMVDEKGFDVVIGNPPWVSLKGKHKSLDLPDEHLKFFFNKYECDTYMPNIYELFVR
ncbi:MAG: N-6 DNA methylase, partial [bacterium]|nr:N-6 DNA methylase [bacterium]